MANQRRANTTRKEVSYDDAVLAALDAEAAGLGIPTAELLRKIAAEHLAKSDAEQSDSLSKDEFERICTTLDTNMSVMAAMVCNSNDMLARAINEFARTQDASTSSPSKALPKPKAIAVETPSGKVTPRDLRWRFAGDERKWVASQMLADKSLRGKYTASEWHERYRIAQMATERKVLSDNGQVN